MNGRKGTTFALSSRGEPHEFCATIGQNGFAEELSDKPGITVLSVEVVREINNQFGGTLAELLQPGDLKDNIMTEGLGDLSDLDPGTLIRVGPEVVLVMQFRCIYNRKNFSLLPPPVLSILQSRGGINCSIVKGAGTRITTDYEIEILPEKYVLQGAA